MLVRLIPAKWTSGLRIIEADLSYEEIHGYNKQGYNVYYWPNYPSIVHPNENVDGRDIDNFQFVFVDYDLKSNIYASKDAFIASISIPPTMVVDSGNGVHVYWEVSNLDVNSYLRFQRRLMSLYKTDPAVSKIAQLMRLPGTLNVKDQNRYVPCEILTHNDVVYTAEEMNNLLPPLSAKDEQYCQDHYNQTFQDESQIVIPSEMPKKWHQLLKSIPEASKLYAGVGNDRSKDDYRLGHLMFANGFNKEEAMTVLANSAKASERAPRHRVNYARNIVDKIWTFEAAEDKSSLTLSKSVRDVLQQGEGDIKGTRFPCHPWIDNTVHGFRLGQVIGLVAGSGVGKTAFALNMFHWFAQRNPNYHHFFIPLEQPVNEIADRWKSLCGSDTSLHDKVHLISNYDDNGGFRHLSLSDIKEYILKFQRVTGFQVGCVVIDHIGVLKNDDSLDNVAGICHQMKSFAVETNTLLVMQSQTARQKAGAGDLELDKDAAYGTVFFESYCDYLITLWQPLKRCHGAEDCPTITAFKFCKIRHKKAKRDVIKEDEINYLNFDSENERLTELNEQQNNSLKYWLKQAANKRKADKNDAVLEYNSITTKESDLNVPTNRH